MAGEARPQKPPSPAACTAARVVVLFALCLCDGLAAAPGQAVAVGSGGTVFLPLARRDSSVDPGSVPGVVTLDGILTTGADRPGMRLLFEPGEALRLQLKVTNRGAITSHVMLEYRVAGSGGQPLAVHDCHTLSVRPGTHWYAIERIVPAVPAGPYTFSGTLYVPVPTSTTLTSDVYIAGARLDSDDFTVPSARWLSGDDGDTACGPLAGQYQALVRVAGLDRECMSTVAAAGVALEVDLRFEGTADGAAGLVLDYAAPDSFLAFALNRDGRFALVAVAPGVPTVKVVLAHGAVTLAEGETVHLAAVRGAGQVDLYVNGRHRAVVELAAPVPAQVGLYAQARQAGLDARFDNWRAVRLP